MRNFNANALVGLALVLALSTLSISGCASQQQGLSERLDERTGVTTTALDSPITLVRQAPDLAVGSRDYAFVGPVEVNRMGKRSYYLWIGLASTVDRARTREVPPRPVSLSMIVDGVPLVIELEEERGDQGAQRYRTPLPVYGVYRAPVSLDIVKLLAHEDTLRLGLEGSRDAWMYEAWSGDSQAWLALLDWPIDSGEDQEAYTRRRW